MIKYNLPPIAIKNIEGVINTYKHLIKIHYNNNRLLDIKDKNEVSQLYFSIRNIRKVTNGTLYYNIEYIGSETTLEVINTSITVDKISAILESWCEVLKFYKEDNTFDDPVLSHLNKQYEEMYNEKNWLESETDDEYFSLKEQKLLAGFYKDIHTLIVKNKEYISEEEYQQVQKEVLTAEKSFTTETKKEHRKRIIKINALLSKFSYAVAEVFLKKASELLFDKGLEYANKVIDLL